MKAVTALSNVPESNRVFLLDEKLRDPLSLIAGDLFKDNEVTFLSTAMKPNPKTDINLVIVLMALMYWMPYLAPRCS